MLHHEENLSGKKLGTCTLETLIGRGGMGSVYLARQERPQQRVAVKILQAVPGNGETSKQFLARFQREANLIAKLEHINIMPLYEYGEQDGLAYLVMPYITGGSLRDLLARRGSLNLFEALPYMQQAAAALDYAHAQGIIHRDLKPANFLLHADGRLILADFGIARMLEDDMHPGAGTTLTGTGMLIGTPEYMAPEMVRGEPIDHRADIYELGIDAIPNVGSSALSVLSLQPIFVENDGGNVFLNKSSARCSFRQMLSFTFAGFEIQHIVSSESLLTITACALTSTSACPSCSQASTHVHSYYTRSPQDWPISGRSVRLVLRVRRFRCPNPQCPRQTFAERLPNLPVSARQTSRLGTILESIAVVLSGQAGSRLTEQLAMPVSADTLLRRAKKKTSVLPTPRVLGVDDFGATRSYVCSCKDSRKEDLTRSSASSAEPSLNKERLGQCSRTRKGDLGTTRGRGDC